MTPERPVDDLTSIEDFEQRLERVLVSALAGDVDPRGSWVYRTDGVGPDLEVMIVELEDTHAQD